MPYSYPPTEYPDFVLWAAGLANFIETGTSDISGAANLVYASPNGSPGNADLRALVSADIPNLDAAKITTGTLNAARIPNLDASKITTGTLDAARIPSLDASKVTTGTFDAARIPNLDTSKVTTGTFNNARINFAAPSAIGGTTPAAGTFTTLKYNIWQGNFYSYNATNTIPEDASVIVGFGGAGFTLTLPSVSGHRSTGFAGFIAIKSALTAGNITVQRAGADVIDSAATSFTLTPGQGRILFATETNQWRSFGDV